MRRKKKREESVSTLAKKVNLNRSTRLFGDRFVESNDCIGCMIVNQLVRLVSCFAAAGTAKRQVNGIKIDREKEIEKKENKS